jgi:hypothetical protein
MTKQLSKGRCGQNFAIKKKSIIIAIVALNLHDVNNVQIINRQKNKNAIKYDSNILDPNYMMFQ